MSEQPKQIRQEMADPDTEQLLRDAIDDLPDPSQGTGPFVPTSLQVIRVKAARELLWPSRRSR